MCQPTSHELWLPRTIERIMYDFQLLFSSVQFVSAQRCFQESSSTRVITGCDALRTIPGPMIFLHDFTIFNFVCSFFSHFVLTKSQYMRLYFCFLFSFIIYFHSCYVLILFLFQFSSSFFFFTFDIVLISQHVIAVDNKREKKIRNRNFFLAFVVVLLA